MKTGKLLEQIVYTDGENKITLSRTMTAEYNIVNGEIEIEWAGGDGDDYESMDRLELAMDQVT